MSASRKRSLNEPRRMPPMLSWLAFRPRWLQATCRAAPPGVFQVKLGSARSACSHSTNAYMLDLCI